MLSWQLLAHILFRVDVPSRDHEMNSQVLGSLCERVHQVGSLDQTSAAHYDRKPSSRESVIAPEYHTILLKNDFLTNEKRESLQTLLLPCHEVGYDLYL